VPDNITPIFLPSRAPELNPVENVWQYPRQNWLSNMVFENYDAIIDAACVAWRKLTADPQRITSIEMRDGGSRRSAPWAGRADQCGSKTSPLNVRPIRLANYLVQNFIGTHIELPGCVCDAAVGIRTMSGIGFALGYDPSASVRDMADVMSRAESAGYGFGFFSETFYTNRDSVTSLTAFAGATTSMKLGTTQVVRLRSPLVMAQTLATLDEYAGGRVTLTVGASTERHSLRNGMSHLPAPQLLREYINAIRLLLTGESVSYAGEYVHLDNVGLNWKPKRSSVPIWVAGASKIGLKIAAEMADGVLLDAGTSPEYSENAIAIIRASREAAGKSMGDFTVAQLVNTSIESTKKQAIDAVRWEIASKFRSPTTARAKVAVGEPNIDPDAPQRLSSAYLEGGQDALMKAIPDSYVEALTASGTVDDVTERVNKYRRAGVSLPLVRAAASHQLPALMNAAQYLSDI
jgi:5,10-methylenetetrahydromethanopterin reductase